jgi:hypothetical protein
MSGCADLGWSGQVGVWEPVPAALPIRSLTYVPFDANVCNDEGCGLIADVLSPLVK